MADVVDKVSVPVEVQDKTGPGLAKATKSISKSATQMSGMVGEKAGRAMSQFNEKTEKGRQLLTTFGGAMGGVAGETVYYAGTLSYVIGRFSLWELGIMAVVAAIGALVWVLTDATEETEALEKASERAAKFIVKLRDSVDDLAESSRRQLNNMDAYSIAIDKTSKTVDMYKESIDGLTTLIKEEEKESLHRSDEYYFRLNKRAQMENELKEVEAEHARLKVIQLDHYNAKEAEFSADQKRRWEEEKKRDEERARKERERGARTGARDTGYKMRFGEGGEIDIAAAMEADARAVAKWEADNERRKLSLELAARNAEVQAFADAEARKNAILQQAYDYRMSMVDQYSGMVIGVLGAMAAAEEGQAMAAAGAQLKALGLTNLWEGLTEGARSLAALAMWDYKGFVLHGTAALEHGAIAAALGAGGAAMSSVGGGGRGGGAAASTAANLPQSQAGGRKDEAQGTTYNFYIGGSQILGSDADRIFADGAQRHITSQSPGRADRKL